MNKNYIFLTILMVVLAFGTLLLGGKSERNQLEPDQLLQEIIQPTRYVSSDQIAKMIIQGEPGLMLIDVRSEDEYNEFALPNALNIPLENIADEDRLVYLGIPGTKVIFYSNDDIKADQVWVLTKRMGYSSTYVLKGGVNRWMETVIEPEFPGADASSVDLELYSFRKGAQQFFTGAAAETDNAVKMDVQVNRREKTSVAAGGC